MAVKDQCLKCKNFNEELCSVTSANPEYNQRSCENYLKNGINLEKQVSSDRSESQKSGIQSVTPINEPAVDTSSRRAEEIRNPDHLPVPEKQRLFAHPFSFEGRIRRLEFGISMVGCFLWNIFVSVAAESNNAGMSAIMLLSYIPFLWFYIAQNCKRFHDRGKSGLHYFTYFIPLYNFIVLLMQFFADGDDFENDYGPDPKGRDICV